MKSCDVQTYNSSFESCKFLNVYYLSKIHQENIKPNLLFLPGNGCNERDLCMCVITLLTND